MPFASMDEAARKKLEQELRFLKESVDAEVISKEEYERGKERIEKKLRGNESNNGNHNEEIIQSQKSEINEIETKTESKNQSKNEETSEVKKNAETQQPPAETSEQKTEGKKDNKAFKYAIVFLVLTIIVFFGYSIFKQNKALEKEETKITQVIPDIKKIKVTVLNDRKNCFNCDTERVLGIIENWFGALDVNEVDYNTEHGKELADKFGLRALPAYIFESDITNKTVYNQIKQTFINKNENYILSDNAAASTFYFRRENILNKLDFFAKEGDASSLKAEKNLKEFLESFPDVRFEKHSSDSELAKELGVRTFPAFLVNNKVKFIGIQTAEMIKNNFCSMNKLEECKKELSNNLI